MTNKALGTMLAAATLVAALLLHGCGKPVPEKGSPNFVFLLIDTLRKDHISAYGYTRPTTPNIDSLAADGLLFENNVAQAPWTPPSVGSMFTSKYPTETGIGVAEDSRGARELKGSTVTGLGDDALTLAEVLKKGGYRTVGYSANPYFDGKYGFWQGFDIRDQQVEAPAETIVGSAIKYLEGSYARGASGRPPFFLYLHFMDTHAPNHPPAPYDTMYPTRDKMPHEPRHSMWGAGVAETYNQGEHLGGDDFENYKSHKEALYDGSLTSIDSQIGRLVATLKKLGLYDSTVIIIVADHGEELWDHAIYEKEHFPLPFAKKRYGVGHSHTLFGELLDVPLIFHGRGLPKGRIPGQVRNIDVMPSVLGIAGLKDGAPGMEGADIVGLAAAGGFTGLPAFSENIAHGYEMKALQDRGFKYLRYYGPGQRDYLFDRGSDPHEQADVSAAHPDLTRRMSAGLDRMLAGMKRQSRAPVQMDEQTKKRLRSLGYIN